MGRTSSFTLEVMKSLWETWNEVPKVLDPSCQYSQESKNLPREKSLQIEVGETSSHHLQENKPLSWPPESTETIETLA